MSSSSALNSNFSRHVMRPDRYRELELHDMAATSQDDSLMAAALVHWPRFHIFSAIHRSPNRRCIAFMFLSSGVILSGKKTEIWPCHQRLICP